MRRSSLTRGFTLIELLVVLVIIGILAAPHYDGPVPAPWMLFA